MTLRRECPDCHKSQVEVWDGMYDGVRWERCDDCWKKTLTPEELAEYERLQGRLRKPDF